MKKVKHSLEIQKHKILFGFWLEQVEGMHKAINQFSIRTKIFSGLNETIAEQIIKLRPTAPNIVVFAHPSDMNGLLENVRAF